MAKFRSFKVNLSLPYIGGIEGTWEPDENERKAAWEMYVELVTRVSVVELKQDEGLLREALSSLYALFGITRQILKEHGPDIAQPKNESDLSFGYIAVAVLNTVIRPLLAKWHPQLLDYENRRASNTSTIEHERHWELNSQLRSDLEKVRLILIDYANLLADITDIPSLIIDRN